RRPRTLRRSARRASPGHARLSDQLVAKAHHRISRHQPAVWELSLCLRPSPNGRGRFAAGESGEGSKKIRASKTTRQGAERTSDGSNDFGRGTLAHFVDCTSWLPS